MKTLPRIAVAAATLLLIAQFPAPNLSAQDFSGLTFCFDAGHGAGSPNIGPTGVREAEINLSVVLALRDMLVAAGADTVVLTRSTNAESLSLSARERIANQAGVGWFHSVHHNATGLPSNTTIDYTLVLYGEGSNRQPRWPNQTDKMSEFMADRMHRAMFTSEARVSGDFSFYGTPNFLGVLNDLQMPGELSEATFFDNRTMEQRLRNADYLRIEAFALFLALSDYFEAGESLVGAISGLARDADTRAFLDSTTVLLQPAGQSYETDMWANGYFAFHDLEPGTYTLTAARPGYDTLSTTVTVEPHGITAKSLALIPDVAPVITASRPVPGTEGFDVWEKLFLRFSKPMDVASVLSGYSLTPALPGTLTADSRGEVFSFEPDFRFAFGTSYVFSLDPATSDIHGHPLSEDTPYELQFRTTPLDTTFPLITSFYPGKDATTVSTRELVSISFNREIDASTLIDNRTVFAINNAQERTPLRVVPSSGPGREQFVLVPDKPFRADAVYFVTLTSGIKDFLGNGMQSGVRWRFTTEPDMEPWIALASFAEDEAVFLSPATHPETRGVLADSLTAGRSGTIALSDTSAYSLRAEFAEDSGQVMLEFAPPPPVFDAAASAAVAVFGDSAGVRLGLVFRLADGTQARHEVQVDWHGWRLVQFSAARMELQDEDGRSVSLESEAVWQGIAIRGTAGQETVLFLDDVALRAAPVPTSIRPLAEPEDFHLLKSYPNPMKAGGGPAQISFMITQQTPVSLAAFDILGRRIRQLADRALPPGNHVFSWSGQDAAGNAVSPGIYFIRLKTGARVSVLKHFIVQ